jgi:polysaccharide export outer membrane protein
MRYKLLSSVLLMTSLAWTSLAAEYTLRPGDQLSIVVTQQEDISTSVANGGTATPYQIRPDGRVSVPFVGEIDANGMTVSQFTDTLRTGLSRYIVDPDVSVNIIKLGGVRVYVFGEVNKPGVYELTKSHRVIDAIGAASGFNWDTAKKKIFLIHQDNPEKAIPINLNHILKTGDMTENYELREGDILYLTKNSRISFARDIAPIFSSAYMASEIKKNNDD